MVSPHNARYREFIRRLCEARAEAGLTQRQVAAQLSKSLGLPQQAISRMETGERRVDVIEFMALADLYGKPLDYFRPKRRKGSV